MTFEQLVKELEEKIQASYEEGVTLDEAERLAGRFLHAQMQVSAELKKADLDARVRKSGVKALRAALYLESVQKSDKKPTEAQLAAMIDSASLVKGEQNSFDQAEVDRDDLERYYDIFTNAHIHFRTVSRGRFND